MVDIWNDEMNSEEDRACNWERARAKSPERSEGWLRGSALLNETRVG